MKKRFFSVIVWPMKFLHTSDWHLGKVLHEMSLLEDQRFILEQILQFLQEDPHDALLIAGDIFDRSIPPEQALLLFNGFLKKLRENSDCQVFIIPGNHDGPLRMEYGAPFFSLGRIHIQCDPAQVGHPLVLQKGEETVHIYLWPFLEPYAFAGDRKEGDDKRWSHEDVVREAIGRMKANPLWNPDIPQVVVAHLFVQGGESSDSERKLVGTLEGVDADLFRDFTYVALGHLHRPQKIRDNVRYAGSPLKYSFSETSHRKKILSVEVKGKAVEVKEIDLVPLKDMMRAEGSFQEFLEGPLGEEWKNHYLEIQLTDPIIKPMAMTILKNRFPHLLHLRQGYERDSDERESGESPETSEGDSSGPQGEESHFRSFFQFIQGGDPSLEELLLFKELMIEAGKNCDL